MKYIHINPTALSSALGKIKEYCIFTGNYHALTGEGTHPSIEERINEIGPHILFNDINYDKTISFINTFNAAIEFNNQHFTTCKMLVERNIKANVATEEDYLMLAMVTTYMYDNNKKNLEALQLINNAKQISVYPTINLPKQEAIVLIRLHKNDEAINCLIEYREWTQKMIHKVGIL